MDKLNKAIERIKTGSEMSFRYYGKPLLITYSGGKDSDAVLEIAKISGIPFEVLHKHTTADAPETVRHVRDKFHALECDGIQCRIEYPVYRGEKTSMWRLIEKKMYPPTRFVRYCCEVLKEGGGKGRAIATGVRWSESVKRAKTRGIAETYTSDPKKKIILNNDNDDKRKLIEHCQRQGRSVFNPIVDWDNGDVWGLIHDRHVSANPLYASGFCRVGCIGCPMGGKSRSLEFYRYPQYKNMYLRSFARLIERRKESGKDTTGIFASPSALFDWWMEDKNLEGQTNMFEEMETDDEHSNLDGEADRRP